MNQAGAAVVRLLQPDDWEIVRAVRLRALDDAPQAFGMTWAAAMGRGESDWRRLLSQRAQFVATLNGVDVGTAAATAHGPRTAHLHSMWVAPVARGTGVSGLLIRHIVMWAKTRGCDRVVLEVIEGNQRAERTYARHGFVRTGRVGRVAEGDPRREVEMALRW